MKELIKTYEEYIRLLEEENGRLTVVALVHGVSNNEEKIKLGQELRDKIKKLIPKIYYL